MSDKRNQRIVAVATMAEHITAITVTNALNQLRAQRAKAIIDGPDKIETVGRSTSTTSTTERQAAEGHRLGLLIEDGYDLINGLEIAHKALLDWANQGCRTRAFSAPATPGEDTPKVAVCRDMQFGKAGAIEWGDPLCIKAGVKSGLCGAHYMHWYRYRRDHGINTANDFELGAA